MATMATGIDAKLLKSTKFPPEFNQKVDMQKVNLQVMKKLRHPPQSILELPWRVLTSWLSAGGSLAESPRYWGMRMMLSLSYASTSSRAPDT